MKIVVPTELSDQRVEVIAKRGLIAVHAMPDDWRDKASIVADPTACVNITHLPTRLAIAKGVPLLKAKELLIELIKLDWDFTDYRLMPEETRRVALELVREYRQPSVFDSDRYQEFRKRHLETTGK